MGLAPGIGQDRAAAYGGASEAPWVTASTSLGGPDRRTGGRPHPWGPTPRRGLAARPDARVRRMHETAGARSRSPGAAGTGADTGAYEGGRAGQAPLPDGMAGRPCTAPGRAAGHRWVPSGARPRRWPGPGRAHGVCLRWPRPGSTAPRWDLAARAGRTRAAGTRRRGPTVAGRARVHCGCRGPTAPRQALDGPRPSQMSPAVAPAGPGRRDSRTRAARARECGLRRATGGPCPLPC